MPQRERTAISGALGLVSACSRCLHGKLRVMGVQRRSGVPGDSGAACGSLDA